MTAYVTTLILEKYVWKCERKDIYWASYLVLLPHDGSDHCCNLTCRIPNALSHRHAQVLGPLLFMWRLYRKMLTIPCLTLTRTLTQCHVIAIEYESGKSPVRGSTWTPLAVNTWSYDHACICGSHCGIIRLPRVAVFFWLTLQYSRASINPLTNCRAAAPWAVISLQVKLRKIHGTISWNALSCNESHYPKPQKCISFEKDPSSVKFDLHHTLQ